MVTNLCKLFCVKHKSADLVSVVTDGVGCDYKWVFQQLLGFLKENNHHVQLIETNHNSKISIINLLVVLWWMGNYVVDTKQFRLAGISNLLWWVEDFASDLLVLK